MCQHDFFFENNLVEAKKPVVPNNKVLSGITMFGSHHNTMNQFFDKEHEKQFKICNFDSYTQEQIIEIDTKINKDDEFDRAHHIHRYGGYGTEYSQ